MRTDKLLSLLKKQRNEFNLIKGTCSPEGMGEDEILLFREHTKELPESPWGTPPSTPISRHPRVLLTAENLPFIRKNLKKNRASTKYFARQLSKTLEDGGILPPPVDQGINVIVNNNNFHNFDYNVLDLIQAKALGYLVYGEARYGYEAIYYLKNFMRSLKIIKIALDQCRQYGYAMFTAALVYDWCYPLLNDDDKTQLIAGVENCFCRGENTRGPKMEVKFPPSEQCAFNGHGAEYQVLRDYLSFAIAIYDENPSWWRYIGSRVYYDYVPPRNYYFRSGMTPQGTGNYIAARHIGDLYSAWLLKTATGDHPYVGMEPIVRNILGYEISPGKLFSDGDWTCDYIGAARYISLIYISAYLFKDSAMLAQAKFIQGNNDVFAPTHSGISTTVLIALRGLCELEPSKDRYEKMELIQYNGYPITQYIAREAWKKESSPAAFMRIKEFSGSGHEHCDAGTFQIYYKGMLSSDGGVYRNCGSPHNQYFHQATISHNGLIIYNPALINEDKGYYSGGQKKYPGYRNMEAWLACKNLKTGKLIGRSHAYDEHGVPTYAYISGDISDAYNEKAASYVGRRMLTVFTKNRKYPMVFFSYDDITAASASFEKRFLLQITSKNSPEISEAKKTVITENEGGRLILKCLSDSVTFRGVGGRNEGEYDASLSRNYIIEGKQLLPIHNTADDGHWGRVEIVSTKRRKSATFLNVITVTDKGNEKAPVIRRITKAIGLEGAIFESTVALFATARGGASDTLSCSVHGRRNMKYYVSGLSAGTWHVSLDGKDIGVYETTRDCDLITFSAPSGNIVISKE